MSIGISLLGRILEVACLLIPLVYLSIKDLRERTIPNVSILAIILIHVAHVMVRSLVNGVPPGQALQELFFLLIQAVVVGAAFLLFTLIMDYVLGKESAGGGDIKLFAVTAFCLGWRRCIVAVMLACVFGVIFFGIRWVLARCANKKAQDDIAAYPEGSFAWGPWIALALCLLMVLGD